MGENPSAKGCLPFIDNVLQDFRILQFYQRIYCNRHNNLLNSSLQTGKPLR
ncbi:MAG: hypothetical protein LBU34_16150 [Planctomycetaceae bacterium]|nr:hypothetical protein [Planctomycetaceae bacterium]